MKVDGVTQDGRETQFAQFTKEAREAWLCRRLKDLGELAATHTFPPLAIEYAYYDVDTSLSTTQPMLVCADAGYNPHIALCAKLVPEWLGVTEFVRMWSAVGATVEGIGGVWEGWEDQLAAVEQEPEEGLEWALTNIARDLDQTGPCSAHRRAALLFFAECIRARLSAPDLAHSTKHKH